jgi:hypothetical protein
MKRGREDDGQRAADRFPPGIVYSIGFEDGAAIEVHEGQLAEEHLPSREK